MITQSFQFFKILKNCEFLQKNADLVICDNNNEEKAILVTLDIRSVAIIRNIICTTLVFNHFSCELWKYYQKILSVIAREMKENDVSFNKITPLLKLTEKQIHLKARYFAQEIRQLRTSSKMFLERIKSVNDEEQMMLE